ncbi:MULTISPECIES: SDR family NAD(P)-dependent oxidoreductase [unclassified Novosphingobium]|uniref:SDR family NAD(P)-dependent oxidoreductase n=1 Tax=unclassified Novosphingobium TaxID=2644732 RepID=UPI00135B1FEF|nr:MULTISPECIES: SDR family oxidoreductase [unclassified Novosphingobium]
MRLKEKVAVITGAGSGMGRCMAELFVREGAKVVCADRSGRQDEVAEWLGADAAIAVQCDVGIGADVQRMITTAEERFGRLDILCNNAGFGGRMMPLHEQTEENFEIVHAANLRGVFLGMKYGIISMLKTGGGAIVNTASAAAVVGWKHHAIYSGAKAGVLQMTKSAALDYAEQGIRINAVLPGNTWTGLVPASQGNAAPPPGTRALPGVPMNRWGLPQEIAAAALFLASDDASFTTGAALPVDGGYTIGFSGMAAETSDAPEFPPPF